MIDASQPGTKNEILEELISTCKRAEKTLMNTIANLENEKMMNTALAVNDDLQ